MSALVKVATAAQEPEAIMLQNMLAEEGVHSVVKRDGSMDIPGMLSGGRRQIMVEPDDEEKALEILSAYQQAAVQDVEDAGEAEQLISVGLKKKAGWLMLLLYAGPGIVATGLFVYYIVLR